jgi:hypothetical protein
VSFRSTHGLTFEASPWKVKPWYQFNIGTCCGQWRDKEKSYEVLSIINDVPGNGHLDDVLGWFEYFCRRDAKYLRIREFFLNPAFKEHLIKKRGFRAEGKDDVIKTFK